MTALRQDLPDVPARMKKLKLDTRGYPVPWFVAYVDGVPDFRVIRPGGIIKALARRSCWLCGEHMGRFGAFVIGPMCAINRVSAEPPSHLGCAEFAVRACPFLVRPQAKRREANLPEESTEGAGMMIKRNPGVTLLWVSKGWNPFRTDNGYLMNVGEPDSVQWFAEGRPATLHEVAASVDSGLPILRQAAEQDGPAALTELDARLGAAVALYPAT